LKKPKRGWAHFFAQLYVRSRDDDIADLGAQLAFYLLLSMFPFILFLLSILSFTPISVADFVWRIAQFLPKEVADIVGEIINEIFGARRTALLSIGALIALWSASKGVSAISKALNKAYDAKETRPYWKVHGVAVVFTISLAAVIPVILLLLIFGESAGNYIVNALDGEDPLGLFTGGLRYAAAGTVMVLVFSLLYKYIPDRRIKFRYVLPGAVFSSAGGILTSLLFSFYVSNFASYTRTYGSLGGIILLLTWIYINSVIVLFGGEINAVCFYSRPDSERVSR